jgi:hypothetical protein
MTKVQLIILGGEEVGRWQLSRIIAWFLYDNLPSLYLGPDRSEPQAIRQKKCQGQAPWHHKMKKVLDGDYAGKGNDLVSEGEVEAEGVNLAGGLILKLEA